MIQYHAETLFLNVADPEKDAWKWRSAQAMLFEIPNKACSFYIWDFLLSFRSLLTVSDVGQITNATLPPTENTGDLSASPAESESLRLAFCSMREEKQLTDVVLIPDTEDDESVTMFPAHRAYLAANSAYFSGAFSGNFRESGVASADHPIQIRMDGYSSYSVQILLGKSSYILSGMIELMGVSLCDYKTFYTKMLSVRLPKTTSLRSCICPIIGALKDRSYIMKFSGGLFFRD
jgi:hypothetical protein